MKKRAVFLDRDGTIMKDKHYLDDPEQVELLEGAAEGLRRLQNMGFKLVIVTNQSGIKRSIIQEKNLELIHSRLRELLKKEEVTIDAIYYSPDLPFEKSLTRKPGTALLDRAVEQLNLTLKGSYCIGDKKEDIDMGEKGGLVTILVLTGYGEKNRDKTNCNYIAHDLLDAAKWITSREYPKKP